MNLEISLTFLIGVGLGYYVTVHYKRTGKLV
jgi:hypothetical protein